MSYEILELITITAKNLEKEEQGKKVEE